EDRRIRANAQRQRQHRRSRKSRILSQHPQAVPQVLTEILEPPPTPRFSPALLQIHRIPKRPRRRIPRFALFLVRYSRRSLRARRLGDQLALLHLSVRSHFLVQLPRRILSTH